MSLYSARKKAGLSQAAVAKELGIAPASVCQWETGKTAPRFNLLQKIARVYGCTIDELLKNEAEDIQDVPEF